MGQIERLEPRQLLSIGEIDTSFGTNGVVEPDEQIHTISGSLPGLNGQFLILTDDQTVKIFNADGSLSRSVPLKFESSHRPYLNSLLALNDGTFLTTSFEQVGADENGLGGDTLGGIEHFNSGGTIDTNFHGPLISSTGGNARAVVQPDGKILFLAGGQVLRLLADGSEDPDFQRYTNPQNDFNAYSLALQPNGKIVCGGYFAGGKKFDVIALRRFNSDGTIDTTFGNLGTLRHPRNHGSLSRDFILPLPDGGLLVSLNIDFKGMVVRRYTPHGKLDTTFGDAGETRISFSNLDAAGNDTTFRMLDDGRILLLGSTQDEAGTSTGTIAILKANGAVDYAFPPTSSIYNFFAGDVISTGDLVFPEYGQRQNLMKLQLTGTPANTRIDSQTLLVNGDAADNRITVQQSLQDVWVSSSTDYLFDRVFAVDQVKRIKINAGAGDDQVHLLATVSKPATVIGGDGNDNIRGGSGRDFLYGSAGNDKIDGGGGSDLLSGGGGNDHLRGQAGPDRIYGGAGNDTIEGNGGPDRLYGGSGSDSLRGGAGNDQFDAHDSTADSLFGDGGLDSAVVDVVDLLRSIEITTP